MSNFTENENWIDKLVDEVVDVTERNAELTVSEDRLNILIAIILNNSGLNYSKDELTINKESAVLEFVKAIAPASYLKRFNALTEIKTEEDSSNG